jgi:threonine dehydrogenase-like Zn-dependent dehydrogenase
MSEQATFVVLIGPRRLEVRQGPIPDTGDDDGILALEACGVCGTDVEAYEGNTDRWDGTIPGHEPMGRILRAGKSAQKRWGVQEGDRVAVHSLLSCGSCLACRTGKEPCMSAGFERGYGGMSPDVPPGLWGGYSTHMYLAPESILLPMSPDLSVGAASLFSVMANGVDWVLNIGGLRPGMSVAILGPGPRGLACAMAAQVGGAAEIAMTGLSADRNRLDLAKAMGVDHVIEVSPEESGVDQVLAAMSRPPDMVLDCTPMALGPVADAIHMAATEGTVVLAGVKGPGRDAPLPIEVAMSKRLHIKGVWSRSVQSMQAAITILESGAWPLDQFASHAYPVERTEEGLLALLSDDKPMHVRIVPSV